MLGGCGDGTDEVSFLAVAFRLDEGYPVMVAYAGDPTEDPFLLPAGRYYVEAVNQDGVVFSRAVVETEGGQPVGFPPNMGTTEDLAPPAAEPLMTLANFLVDAELAEYAFLEIVSGGFEQPLFDPDIEIAAADVEGLFGMYEDILSQKDGVLAAFEQIKERAQVSGHSLCVSWRWGQEGEELDQPFFRVQTLFDALPQDWEEKERAQQEAEAALARETDWVMTWNRDLRTGVLRPGFALKKTLEWEAKHREWEHYAEYLVERLPSGGDQAALAQAQKELTDAIKGDFEAWLAKNGVVEFPPEAVEVFANYFVAETFAAAGQPVTVPTPPPGFWGASTPAVPTPDTGWIEDYVQAVGEQWVDEGYGVEALLAVERLKACLTEAAEGGASREEAIAQCPAKAFKPTATPQPTETPAAEETETPAPEPTETPAAEETETPAAEQTGTPPPEPTQMPTPEPAATPTPQGQNVAATGQLTDLYKPSEITANSITLGFNSQGGPVSGEAHFEKRYQGTCRTASDEWIEGTIVWTWDVVFDGTYFEDTQQLDGTAQITFRHVTCQRGAAWSEPWSATLQGGQVMGRFLEDCDWVASLHEWPNSTPECLPGAEDRFTLTAQGQ
jgi:hypothetical protein